MYTDEQIKELFKNKIPQDVEAQSYFDMYVNVYKNSFMRPTNSDKYNFHHFYCSFLAKSDWGEKNRHHTIEKLDEAYNPNDNVCKLRILYHVIAHWCLGMALRNTPFAVDARNSFFTLISDYSRNIESYDFDEVKELGRLVEENSQPNTLNHYVTQLERKKLYKQTAKENREKYIDEHKKEIELKKHEYKEKRKEYDEKWKEEHKKEIELYKQKQREYARQKRDEWKRNHIAYQ